MERVLNASQGSLSPAWQEHTHEISRQRSLVEHQLAQPNAKPVYGFNTLFGQLDAAGVTTLDQKYMVENHCIGPVSQLSPRDAKVVTACKIEQLNSSFTGISVTTYSGLLDSIQREIPALTGSWWASYGSGDVAPGSWWAHNLLELGFLHELHAGDAMALMNGSFYGAATALSTLLDLRDQLTNALSNVIAAGNFDPRISTLGGEVKAALAGLPDNGHDWFSSPPQLPVAIRDIGPQVFFAVTAWGRALSAIEDSLTKPSGNPLFFHEDSDSQSIEAISNSSFLNLDLAAALDGIARLVRLLCVNQQRILDWLSKQAEATLAPREAVPFVQPPKVALALHLSSAGASGSSPVPYLAESDGVEDVADLTVVTSKQIRSMAESLAAITDLTDETLNQALTISQSDSSAFEARKSQAQQLASGIFSMSPQQAS
nr:aromatic amino acid lyase [Corynebacterium sp. TAE3-ERU12]